jgi:hypothetical protein
MLRFPGKQNSARHERRPPAGGKRRTTRVTPLVEGLESRRLLSGNDTFATALPLGLVSNTPATASGTLVHSTTNAGVDPVYYSFTAPAGATLNFSVTVPVDSNPDRHYFIEEFAGANDRGPGAAAGYSGVINGPSLLARAGVTYYIYNC